MLGAQVKATVQDAFVLCETLLIESFCVQIFNKCTKCYESGFIADIIVSHIYQALCLGLSGIKKCLGLSGIKKCIVMS